MLTLMIPQTTMWNRCCTDGIVPATVSIPYKLISVSEHARLQRAAAYNTVLNSSQISLCSEQHRRGGFTNVYTHWYLSYLVECVINNCIAQVSNKVHAL